MEEQTIDKPFFQYKVLGKRIYYNFYKLFKYFNFYENKQKSHFWHVGGNGDVTGSNARY